MAITLRMCTTISPQQWQSLTAVSPLVGSLAAHSRRTSVWTFFFFKSRSTALSILFSFLCATGVTNWYKILTAEYEDVTKQRTRLEKD